MPKNRIISLTQLHGLSALAIARRKKPFIVTYHGDEAFAVMDVTPEILAEIARQEVQLENGFGPLALGTPMKRSN